MKPKLFLFLILLSAIISSCNTTKHQNYFSIYGSDSSHTYIHQGYEVPIQVGDRLIINVSALNPQSALPYNLNASSASGAGDGTSSTGGSGSGGSAITVEQDGYILYPQLGLIKVEGLTVSSIRNLLLNKLRTYLTDPVVTVDLVNFKVTVIGEVGTPTVLSSPDGRMNILEALAKSGDLTVYAKRYPIMVIRESKGRREFGYVNLLSNSIFSSPYYRLQQNDIIYVPAVENKPTANEQQITRRISLASTIIALVTTLTFAIITFTR